MWAWILDKDRDKLDPKACKGKYFSIELHSKAFCVWDLEAKKVSNITRDRVFPSDTDGYKNTDDTANDDQAQQHGNHQFDQAEAGLRPCRSKCQTG